MGVEEVKEENEREKGRDKGRERIAGLERKGEGWAKKRGDRKRQRRIQMEE